jgi:hypothetical protein
MKIRVSKSHFETHGREEPCDNGEQKFSMEPSEAQTVTEDYKTMLARELFFTDIQEDYCKYY